MDLPPESLLAITETAMPMSTTARGRCLRYVQSAVNNASTDRNTPARPGQHHCRFYTRQKHNNQSLWASNHQMIVQGGYF